MQIIGPMKKKNTAYGRHWISRPMRIKGPIEKKKKKIVFGWNGIYFFGRGGCGYFFITHPLPCQFGWVDFFLHPFPPGGVERGTNERPGSGHLTCGPRLHKISLPLIRTLSIQFKPIYKIYFFYWNIKTFLLMLNVYIVLPKFFWFFVLKCLCFNIFISQHHPLVCNFFEYFFREKILQS